MDGLVKNVENKAEIKVVNDYPTTYNAGHCWEILLH